MGGGELKHFIHVHLVADAIFRHLDLKTLNVCAKVCVRWRAYLYQVQFFIRQIQPALLHLMAKEGLDEVYQGLTLARMDKNPRGDHGWTLLH